MWVCLLSSALPVLGQEDLPEPVLETGQILESSVYDEFVEYVRTLDLSALENTSKPAVPKSAGIFSFKSIVCAASAGWISPCVYFWNGTEYEPRSVFFPCGLQAIRPWEGFWIQPKRNINIVFLRLLSIFEPKSAGTMSITLEPGRYYLVSPPLIPLSGDILNNFGAALGDGYEVDWRFSKWNHETESYQRYTGAGSIPDLIPGRGFWAYHVQPADVTLNLTGSAFPGSGLFNQVECALSLPVKAGNTTSEHMIGNPYHYNIALWNIFIQSASGSSLPAGKVTASGGSLFDSLREWHIDVKLSDSGGLYRDTYNRAGVVESAEDIHHLLTAADLPPMGNHVRIAFRNGPQLFAYDYRSPGRDVYQWDFEATTNLNSIHTHLSLSNLTQVPPGYSITLTDHAANSSIPVTNDTTIELTLTQNAPRQFTLTAERPKPSAIADEKPILIKFGGAFPNPFNPETTLSFDLNKPERVLLRVYTINGQLVETILDKRMQSGAHRVTWNARNHSSGVYLFQAVAGKTVSTIKAALVK